MDDYHPRARLKQVHKKNEINIIEDSASVQTFCNRYVVEESLVKKYQEHLNHLEMMSENWEKWKRKTRMWKRTQCLMRNFTGWKCCNSGTLAKQRVCVVDNVSINIICLRWKVITSRRKSMLLWITYSHFPRAHKQTKLPQCGRGGWSWWMWSRWRGWGITHLS